MCDWESGNILNCIYSFQTLITGILAIVAAIITAFAIVCSSNKNIENEKAKRNEERAFRFKVGKTALMSELSFIQYHVRQNLATIRVVVAANANINEGVREKVRMKIPAVFNDWKLLGLFPETLISQIMDLVDKLEKHNRDMQNAGGAFGADEFRAQINNRLEQISHVAQACRNQIRNFGDYPIDE